MAIVKDLFGRLASGTPVYRYTMSNKSGMRVAILDFGGAIQSLVVPDRDGKLADVVCGYDGLQSYLEGNGYQGALIGRFGNRIAKGRFTLDGKEYTLFQNNNGNHLHGGKVGFSHRIWDVVSATDGEDPTLVLYLLSPDGEEGFPSGLLSRVRFTLQGAAVIIEYEAIPEGKTPIALTNHSYFNLDGFGGVIDNHVMTIYADRYTEVGENLIPTGARPSVEGTPFDFRTPKRIGEDFGKSVDGYDHNFLLCPKFSAKFKEYRLPLAASMTNEKLALNVYTDQPGIQFYTGNFLGGEPDFRGGVKRIKHGAFCLEAQTEPNCVKRGEGFYEAGEIYRQTTVYEVKRDV